MLDQLLATESSREPSQLQNTIINRNRLQEVAILEESRRRLNAQGVAELRALGCEYHEGTLVLRGRLSSHYLKQLAQEAIRKQPGVDLIVNATEVVKRP